MHSFLLMKILSRLFLFASCLAAVGWLSPQPQARAQAMEFFDDFFSDNAGQPRQNFPGLNSGGVPGVNTFIQWNVTNGSVDFVGGNVLGAFAYPDGRFVDLGGSTGQPGTFATAAPIVLVPGVTYNLSFRYVSTEALLSLGGPGANTLEPFPDGPQDTASVSIGGQNFQFSTSSAVFQNFSQDFVAGAANTSLTFLDLGFTDPITGAVRFDNNGVGVDGILVAPAANIPEPGSLALLLLGGGALLFLPGSGRWRAGRRSAIRKAS